MIEQVHNHIISELQQNARTDTAFILTSIFLNLISLGINSAISFKFKDKYKFIYRYVYPCCVSIGCKFYSNFWFTQR